MTKRKREQKTLTASEVTQPIPHVNAAHQEVVVPLVEESLQVDKQWQQAGAARIKKQVETTTQTVPVELAHEEVHVERVRVDRLLAEGESAAPRQEGETLVIPVVEEELVVSKRLRVREELRVTKRQVVDRREVSDTVRRERVDVDSVGNIQSLDG